MTAPLPDHAAPTLAQRLRARLAMWSLARAQEEPEVAADWKRRIGGDSLPNRWAQRRELIESSVASAG